MPVFAYVSDGVMSRRLYRKNSAGFSLIELTVVMVIMALVTGVALPNLVNLYDSVERRTALDTAIQEFNELGRIAARRGQGFILNSEDGVLTSTSPELKPPFPENWRIELDEPITFQGNGVCSGGWFRILDDNDPVLARYLEPPYCQLSFDEQD